MKVTYIYHSCFLVELENTILLFDWFKGDLPELNPRKDIYVFSSHKHHDHFDMKIFELLKNYPKVHYVFSKDIRLSPNYLEKNGVDLSVREAITFVGKNKEVEVGGQDNKLQIKTLTSTDEGVAFVIACEGKKIYHAGDLNWWSWPGEETDELSKMEKDYTREIDKLKDEFFDVAFVVLDPRQQDYYWWGFDYFMRVANPAHVFPMHCWDQYNIIQSLKEESCAKEYLTKIITIDQENQVFSI